MAGEAVVEGQMEETLVEVPAAAGREKSVMLRVRDDRGHEVHVLTGRTAPMQAALAEACKQLDAIHLAYRFVAGSREVLPFDTPEVLGFGEEALIEMQPRVREIRAARDIRSLPVAEADGGRPTLSTTLDTREGVLEWTCLSCGRVHVVGPSEVAESPRLFCSVCGWVGMPRLRHGVQRPATGLSETLAPPKAPATRPPKVKKLATSGQVLAADFEGQHIEAPVGGMVALVSQVQRARLCVGCLCHLLFCLTFVLIVTLVRPVGPIHDIQSSLYSELADEWIPPGVTKFRFHDVANWGDFWLWVDGVLAEKVYSETHYGNRLLGRFVENNATNVSRAVASRFAIGKYNQVVTAIRFRQVRVLPTLPQCKRNETTGLHPTAFQQACMTDSWDKLRSCGTSVYAHDLSRPCWGEWSSVEQDIEYPSAFQLETSEAAHDESKPEEDILCDQSCDAYYLSDYRTSSDWAAFESQAILGWVANFQVANADASVARTACKAACAISGTSLLGTLSALEGHCGDDTGKPSNIEGGGCWGQVVDLPLESVDAKQKLAAMQRERWASEGTRAVVLEINTYNPNFDMATVVRIRVDATPSGQLLPSIQMWSCRISLYGTGLDACRLLLELIFALWVMYYLSIELSEMYTKRRSYLADPWNYMELTNLAIYAFLIGSHGKYVLDTSSDLDSFRHRSPDEFRDLYSIASSFDAFEVAAFSLIYGFYRFFKYFRAHLQFEELWETLVRAMFAVLPLLAVYVILAMGFSWSGHWLFGKRVAAFSTFSDSFATLLLSIKVGTDYSAIQEVAPVAAPIWHICWYICSSCLLVNLLLTVIIRSFRVVKERFHRVASTRQQAINSGINLPHPTTSVLFWLLPESLYLRAKRWLGKASWHQACTSKDVSTLEEKREAEIEIEEALNEVDLDALWQRLLDGVEVDETAVDAEELNHLFGGSAKEARLFINRICNMGGLDRVEVPVEKTTIGEIMEVQDAMQLLHAQVTEFRNDFEEKYSDLRPLLRRDHSGLSLSDSTEDTEVEEEPRHLVAHSRRHLSPLRDPQGLAMAAKVLSDKSKKFKEQPDAYSKGDVFLRRDKFLAYATREPSRRR